MTATTTESITLPSIVVNEDGERMYLCAGTCGTYLDALDIYPECERCRANPGPIAIPQSAQQHEALRTRYDLHSFNHAFEPCHTCGEFEAALAQYEDERETEHESNMTAIAHAEHRAYGECYQFEGDECSTCDDFYAQDRRTA